MFKLILLVWGLFFFLPGFAKAKEKNLICAASSLQAVLENLGPKLQKQHPSLQIQFNYGASNSLARQILHGAPCDVFLSADEFSANRVSFKKRKNLISNQLVLAAPLHSTFSSFQLWDLKKKQIQRIALPYKNVPLGRYARNFLESQGMLLSIKSKMVLTKDARSNLALIERKAVDLGFSYLTDAQRSKKVKILMKVEEEKNKIIYPFVQVREALEAQTLFQALTNPEALRVFKAYGFQILEKP